ncbi:MAG: hypothetical protein NTZ18_03975 [Candidatus Komeilibacteria bacterium]|nr:hypothetical protein [Candidatus Komeilibacteria bacterium]
MPQNNLDGAIKEARDDLAVLESLSRAEKSEPQAEAPEAVFEISPEIKEAIKETAPTGLEQKFSSSPAATAAAPAAVQLTRQVESILAEDLEEAYAKMPRAKQQEFKTQGEETARKIAKLLISAKVKVKEIFLLIFKWLRIIPGVNKYFLEQEAKIKADRLLALKERMQK